MEKIIGKKIQEFRKKKGMTQEELSEVIDISPHYLSALERGIYNIKLDTLVKILNCLDCSADEVFCDVQGSGAEAVASIGHRSAAVMVAVSDAPGLVDIRMNNLPENVYSADVYIMDGVKDLALVQTLPLLGMSRQVCIATGKYSVILIKLY